MKARIDAIIQRNQAEYLEQLTPQTDPLLREMEEYGGGMAFPAPIARWRCSVKLQRGQRTQNGVWK